MKNISKLSVQEVCNYIACMNKLVEEKIVIFKPNKAFIKFNYDKATRHLEKQNIEQKEEIERLNNIIKHTDSWIDRTIEIIKQQPSEDDTWILERLNGIKQCLKGADKE